MELQNVRLPVFLDFEPKPVALFRAERIYTDHQTRAFFKIGVLPLEVLDHLSLQLLDPARLAATLKSATGRFALKERVKQAIEARNFSLSFTTKNSGHLVAQRVRLEDRAAWRLELGVVTAPARPPIRFRTATLIMAGPQVGELLCQTTNGPVDLQLLSLLPRTEN